MDEYDGHPDMSPESDDEAADRCLIPDSEPDSDSSDESDVEIGPLKLIRMQAQLERFDPARMWIQMLARCGKQDTRPRKQGYLPSTILFVQQLGEAEQSCSRCSGRRPFGRSCMT